MFLCYFEEVERVDNIPSQYPHDQRFEGKNGKQNKTPKQQSPKESSSSFGIFFGGIGVDKIKGNKPQSKQLLIETFAIKRIWVLWVCLFAGLKVVCDVTLFPVQNIFGKKRCGRYDTNKAIDFFGLLWSQTFEKHVVGTLVDDQYKMTKKQGSCKQPRAGHALELKQRT